MIYEFYNFFRSLELCPNDPKALFRRCQAYEKLDQADKAYTDGREVRLFVFSHIGTNVFVMTIVPFILMQFTLFIFRFID